ncbi:right-handed parallel beta-helix repeat-containing protein [Methylosinus sp. Sm6]|uniref:right-handed parallel beta-helix repeat-containing protein n=1 Tax=Methylosinus sp. Sm6 TaxID=2866948 RepID=UPI001C9960D8|nr:right-handed parallel beta-helix repeat-containing protein [Methylosinus sp. Sm6]MBY6242931.1 right-handed parallel beta-helix repeat-containing protein [Methylosinus sp. Sm6]
MRNHILTSAAIGAFTLASLGAAPAMAGSGVTYVSGKGADAGSCATPATACRNFAYALSQTDSHGEIKTLDPADYGVVAIAKSVTITGVPGASIEMFSAGSAISIDNGAVTVSLRGIEINGRNVGTSGITVANAKSVSIVDCIVRRVGADGISISPAAGAVTATISNTISSNNGNFGIQFVPGAGAKVTASVDHVTTNNNGFSGILVAPKAAVMISDSIASNNANSGYRASGDATSKMYLSRNVVSGNPTGIHNVTAATVKSFGDNKVYGNTTDVDGAVGSVASK